MDERFDGGGKLDGAAVEAVVGAVGDCAGGGEGEEEDEEGVG